MPYARYSNCRAGSPLLSLARPPPPPKPCPPPPPPQPRAANSFPRLAPLPPAAHHNYRVSRRGEPPQSNQNQWPKGDSELIQLGAGGNDFSQPPPMRYPPMKQQKTECSESKPSVFMRSSSPPPPPPRLSFPLATHSGIRPGSLWRNRYPFRGIHRPRSFRSETE